MSVISRMLRDLEARHAAAGERARQGGSRHFPPGPERRGRHPRGRHGRLGGLALAVALVAIAVALWWQRGPEVWALAAQAFDAGDHRATDAALVVASAAPRPAAPRLSDIRFRGRGGEVALELSVDGAAAVQPGYARSGSIVALRVPAPADGVQIPTPPESQRVFRTAALQQGTGGDATIRLGVADGARFDLERAGNRLTLTGRLPAPEADDETETGDNADDAGGARRELNPALAAKNPPPAAAPPRSGEPAVPAAPQTQRAPEPPADSAAIRLAASAEGAEAAIPAAPASTPAEPTSAPGVDKHDRSPPAVRAQRRYRDARRALAAGEVAAARRALREALVLDAALHPARDLLASLHRRAGEADAARDVLAQGVARAPGRPAYAMPYARLLVDAGELERAARMLADAAAGARADASFHALTAAVAQRRGRYEEAASAYTRALELDAGNGRWWLGLGAALEAAGHADEASASFREARQTRSLSPRLDAWARGRIRALAENGGR